MNIAFIGYRCSGKTTISKDLANRMNWQRVETDKEIENKYNMEIPEIIEKYGWNKFRQTESEVIEKYSAQNNIIIDLGGGAILDKNNIYNLKINSIIVFLYCPIEEILNRLEKSFFRPPLTDLDPKNENLKVYNQRLPIYNDSSDYIINTENLNIDQSSSLVLFYYLENKILQNYYSKSVINSILSKKRIAKPHNQ